MPQALARKPDRSPTRGDTCDPMGRRVQRKPSPAANPEWHRLATGVRVSQPQDASEHEADRVADAVVAGGPAMFHGGVASPSRAVQRMCAACEEEEQVQAKRVSDGSEPARSDGGYLSQLEGGGDELPGHLRDAFEPRFGYDFGDVRVHTDSRAAQSAHAFNAQAYTYGRHVVFGSGQFDTASAGGHRLIAHELAHVVQQSRGGSPALQRKGGPFDLEPDLCVTLPSLGTACGSDAAKVCSTTSLPGCGAVCKVFDCKKPDKPKAVCPPGWRPAGSKDFEGQCCLGTIDSARDCCPPERVAIRDGRCCGSSEVVVDQHCKKSSDLPPNPICLPGQQTWTGKCCVLPEVPIGMNCGIRPAPPPPPTPTPKPKPPVSLQPVFFNLDRPATGESTESFTSAVTGEGKANFDALVKALQENADLKVQLVGRASPEGSIDYNNALGGRRARMVAAALKDAGIPDSRLADPPASDLGADCKPISPGLVTCGKSGAEGERNRQVQVRAVAGNGS